MQAFFSEHPALRLLLLIAVMIGSMISAFFLRTDYVNGVPVLPVYGGITGGCIPCVSFCGGDIAMACIVGPPRPGRVMVDMRPGTPGWIGSIPGAYLYFQFHDGVWWQGGGRPGGSCDIPAPHSGCIGFTITVTSLYNGSSLGVSPLPI
jgi:hypothetical protein